MLSVSLFKSMFSLLVIANWQVYLNRNEKKCVRTFRQTFAVSRNRTISHKQSYLTFRFFKHNSTSDKRSRRCKIRSFQISLKRHPSHLLRGHPFTYQSRPRKLQNSSHDCFDLPKKDQLWVGTAPFSVGLLAEKEEGEGVFIVAKIGFFDPIIDCIVTGSGVSLCGFFFESR